MKKVVGLAVSFLILLGLSGVADAQKKPVKKSNEQKTEQPVEQKSDIKEITIFGVTLGKPFADSKIEECPYKITKYGSGLSDTKSYIFPPPDVTCYKEALMFAKLGLSVKPTIGSISVRFHNGDSDPEVCSYKAKYHKEYNPDCLKKQVVTEITISFASETSDKILELATNKFGKPQYSEKSVVQNKMGATFDNVTYIWTVGNGVMRLEKRASKVDEGYFAATLKIVVDKRDENRKNKDSKLKNQF